jgi:RNA polymerase sigma-70 factor (ECF subfamily)
VSLLAQGFCLEQAQELTQETWARLWAQHHRGALAELSLPGLAITQAGFLARDALRRGLRSAEEAPGPEREAPLPSPEDRLASAQTLRAVRRELGTLPEHHRRAFELAHEGVPHADIGRRLDLTPQRVRQLVWEIRTRLRARFGETP